MNLSQIGLIIDGVLLVILAVSVIIGLKKGFIKQLFGFGSKIIAFIAAICFSDKVGLIIKNKWVGSFVYDKVYEKLGELVTSNASETTQAIEVKYGGLLEFLKLFVNVPSGASSEEVIKAYATTIADKLSGVISNAIAFIGLLVVVWGVVMIIGLILRGLFKLPVLKPIDKIAGAALGLFSGIIICLALTTIAPAVIKVFDSDFQFPLQYSKIVSLLSNLKLVEWLQTRVFGAINIDLSAVTGKIKSFGDSVVNTVQQISETQP